MILFWHRKEGERIIYKHRDNSETIHNRRERQAWWYQMDEADKRKFLALKERGVRAENTGTETTSQ